MFDHLLARKGLSVARLHTLVLLSEHGTLSRAAKGDPGLQSRYSHQLKELSAFVGKELTDKKKGGLTPIGLELANLARTQFRAWEEFNSKAKGLVQQVGIGAGDSLLQWLLIPALGTMRLLGNKQKVLVQNLRTTEVVSRLQDQRLDFGLVRQNAVAKALKCVRIGMVRYVIVVPRRLISRHVTLESALLECPHAMVGGEGELVQKLRSLVGKKGGIYQPELVCDSLSQCMAAVQTGAFAAVLPTQAWETPPGFDCEIVEDKGLADLDRPIVLAWSPRNLETMGSALNKFRLALTSAITEKAENLGMLPT